MMDDDDDDDDAMAVFVSRVWGWGREVKSQQRSIFVNCFFLRGVTGSLRPAKPLKYC